MCHFKLAWHFENIILSNICVANKNKISVHLNYKPSTHNNIQREIIIIKKLKQHFFLHYPIVLEQCRVYLPLSPNFQLLHFIEHQLSQFYFLLVVHIFFKTLILLLANHQVLLPLLLPTYHPSIQLISQTESISML